MKVKICGITRSEDAKTVVKAGADFIGFVFAPSSRRIEPEDAAEISQHIGSTIKKVGVFVNEPVENIIKIANEVELDYIQLHGDEPASTAKAIPFPIIKAFSIDHVSQELLQTYPCDYIIIDSPGEKYRGGSGKTFDWSKLEKLGIDRKKCILAGGLHTGNVQQAISMTNPAGVDVSSGVETNKRKDPTKIVQFIQNVKQ